MAHKDQIREKAERLYVEESKNVTEIATKLQISAQTIYRWIAQVKDKEGFDWQQQREYFHLSSKALVDLYAKAFKRWILKIQKDIDLMAKPQIADAIAKHISTLKKLEPRFNYLGAILDVIHISDRYLEKNDPPLRERMKAHWPEIQKRIKEIATAESPL